MRTSGSWRRHRDGLQVIAIRIIKILQHVARDLDFIPPHTPLCRDGAFRRPNEVHF